MDYTDKKERSLIIRKGNELFNKGDIILAYKCYTMAKYYAGIEKIADYFFYTKQNAAKGIVLYKQIVQEDSNMGGNERAKKKLDEAALKIVEIIRKWNKEDDSEFNAKEEVTLEQKKKYLLAAAGKHKSQFHTKNTENKTSAIKDKQTNNNTTK